MILTDLFLLKATRSAALLLLAILIAAGCKTVSAPGSVTAPGSGAPPDASANKRITEFLQKRFKLPNAAWINISAPVAGPLPGLWTENVVVTNDKGQQARVSLMTDSAASKLILGQVLDTSEDPWGRMDTSALHLADRPTQGPADAPITMIEFADFECPFCARSLTTIETALSSTYRDRVRLVFKHYPLNGHPWARAAAVASECVRRQNPQAFWDFARQFYADQATINSDNLNQHIADFAAKEKLDKQALDACIASKTADAVVNQDVADGALVHVGSTPTILVDGIPVVGSPDDSMLRFVLDSELQSRQAAR